MGEREPGRVLRSFGDKALFLQCGLKMLSVAVGFISLILFCVMGSLSIVSSETPRRVSGFASLAEPQGLKMQNKRFASVLRATPCGMCCVVCAQVHALSQPTHPHLNLERV